MEGVSVIIWFWDLGYGYLQNKDTFFELFSMNLFCLMVNSWEMKNWLNFDDKDYYVTVIEFADEMLRVIFET